MTEHSTVSITAGADTVFFGRGGYLLHDLDVGAASLCDGVTTAREVTFSGYILPEGETAAARAAELERLSRRVRRIVARPEGFTLTVGDRSLALTAKRAPVFAHDAPLNGDEAAYFTVYAGAKDPAAAYFQADTEAAALTRGWQGKLSFPLALPEGEGTLFGLRTAEGTLVMDNPGDVDGGFIAAVTAEDAGITAFTLTAESGERLAVSYPLSVGETLVIDTRPGYKSVTAGGVSVLESLSWDSTFFALVPGENHLSWHSEGDGSVTLRVSLTPRYL